MLLTHIFIFIRHFDRQRKREENLQAFILNYFKFTLQQQNVNTKSLIIREDNLQIIYCRQVVSLKSNQCRRKAGRESHIKKRNDDGIVEFTMKVGSVIGGRRRQRGQSPNGVRTLLLSKVERCWATRLPASARRRLAHNK